MVAMMIPIPLPAVAKGGAIPADPRRRRHPEVAVEEEGGVPVAAAVAEGGGDQGHGRHRRPLLLLIPRPRLNADVAGGDSNKGGAVARHHLPPHHQHRRAPTVGAEAANGHLGDKDDRVLLRDPAHRHRMTTVELPLGGEGHERRRPKKEERRTRSFRLAGPQKPTMNKILWWQHRWM